MRLFELLAACRLMVTLMMLPIFVLSASAEEGSSEVATSNLPAPRFVLVAQGDFEDGYFEDVVVVPGSSVELTVAIVNVGEVPVELRTYKANALSSPNGGFITDEEDSDQRGATQWVEYPTQGIDLGPDTMTEITFRVSVPGGTPPGQYMTSLVAETVEPLPIAGTESLEQILAYSISLAVIVPGEIVHGFELSAPEVTVAGGMRAVVVPFENTGNYLLRPSGQMILTNEAGDVVLESPIQMGSVYSQTSTTVEVFLPDQLADGTYTVQLSLTDTESGVSKTIEAAEISVPSLADNAGVSVLSASVEPNDEEIIFANVDITLANGGQQTAASNVTIEVMRDGELVEEYPLATNQVLLSGENQYTDRYIPAEMWESGTYTFNIVVSAVDPNGGQETILLDEELDATIEVP